MLYEGSPAGPNFQNVVAGLYTSRLDRKIQLPCDGSLQRFVVTNENTLRVTSMSFIEETNIEIIVIFIMLGDRLHVVCHLSEQKRPNKTPKMMRGMPICKHIPKIERAQNITLNIYTAGDIRFCDCSRIKTRDCSKALFAVYYYCERRF